MPSRRSDASIADMMCLRDRPRPLACSVDRVEHLGGEHDLVALREVLQRAADDLLR